MVYNYSNLPKLPFTGYNLPALPAPVSNCAQACAPAYAPYANNSCYNHFNSCYNDYYDVCRNPCDYGFLY